MPHMSTIHSVAQVREIERRAISDHRIPESALMARAGAAAFAELRARWPEVRRIAVCCGPGNNGGDGRVVADCARQAGIEAEVIGLGEAARLDDAFDLVVDALFGIGLSRAPEGEAAKLIDAINALDVPVLALDLPSGLNADTGIATGPVVVADCTVTFITYKRGLFTADGPRVCGRVTLAPLEVPVAAQTGLDAVGAVMPTALAPRLLGARRHDQHKGDSGHVLVVGGAAGLRGAAILAGTAALRTGAGLVSVAVAPGGSAQARPELMVHEFGDVTALHQLLERADVIAVGPGLGRDERAHAALAAVLAAGKPTVIDADALALLADYLPLRANCVLTPHPGEAARMLNVTTAEIQADRYAASAALRALTGGVVVLKGAATQVAAPDAEIQVCAAGNPGMATAGTGDVLTGVIAALMAQGLSPMMAAAAGVQLHAESGDRAAVGGQRGMVAGDLIDQLRPLVNGR